MLRLDLSSAELAGLLSSEELQEQVRTHITPAEILEASGGSHHLVTVTEDISPRPNFEAAYSRVCSIFPQPPLASGEQPDGHLVSILPWEGSKGSRVFRVPRLPAGVDYSAFTTVHAPVYALWFDTADSQELRHVMLAWITYYPQSDLSDGSESGSRSHGSPGNSRNASPAPNNGSNARRALVQLVGAVDSHHSAKYQGALFAAGHPLRWKFTQSFGDDNSSDDDLVTAMCFDPTGNFLAVGDKAGRICVFEVSPEYLMPEQPFLDYKFFTEFQSHEMGFDPLKSLEIEEKINVIEWLRESPCAGRLLLSSNDKTIKLWKLHERVVTDASEYSAAESWRHSGKLRLPPPPVRHDVSLKMASLKREFSKAHQYHINSVSTCSDGEHFISTDDLRINLWNLEIDSECFTIVDSKPEDLQELNEVITMSKFHPWHPNQLLYATSRGNIRLSDMRIRSTCDQWQKQFENDVRGSSDNFFTDIITSVSDALFTPDGRYIMTRDYLTMKIWDSNMEREPVQVVPVHEYLTPYLPELYENDCIFDKFLGDTNRSGQFLTGSYNNYFVVHDSIRNETVTMEARDDPQESATIIPPNPDVTVMDFAKKALNVSWHPNEEVLAVAGMNKIYIYQTIKVSQGE